MTSRLSQTPIDFEKPAEVRRFARIISLSIVMGAVAFAFVITMVPFGPPEPPIPTEHKLYTPFVVISAALVLVGTRLGSRMHGFVGPLAERARRTLTAQIISIALCEGAALLGLILVFLTHSWDVVLPAAIGGAGLLASLIRGELRFGQLVDESRAADPAGSHS